MKKAVISILAFLSIVILAASTIDAAGVSAHIWPGNPKNVYAGEKGKIAYDDAYTAGLAIKYLLTKPYKIEFTDAAKLVLAASLSEIHTEDALEKSCSAKSLRAVGLGSDIAFISQLNRFKVAPLMYAENVLQVKIFVMR